MKGNNYTQTLSSPMSPARIVYPNSISTSNLMTPIKTPKVLRGKKQTPSSPKSPTKFKLMKLKNEK